MKLAKAVGNEAALKKILGNDFSSVVDALDARDSELAIHRLSDEAHLGLLTVVLANSSSAGATGRGRRQ